MNTSFDTFRNQVFAYVYGSRIETEVKLCNEKEPRYWKVVYHLTSPSSFASSTPEESGGGSTQTHTTKSLEAEVLFEDDGVNEQTSQEECVTKAWSVVRRPALKWFTKVKADQGNNNRIQNRTLSSQLRRDDESEITNCSVPALSASPLDVIADLRKNESNKEKHAKHKLCTLLDDEDILQFALYCDVKSRLRKDAHLFEEAVLYDYARMSIIDAYNECKSKHFPLDTTTIYHQRVSKEKLSTAESILEQLLSDS